MAHEERYRWWPFAGAQNNLDRWRETNSVTSNARREPGQMVIRRFRGQRTGDEQSESDDEDTHQAAS